MPASRGRTVVVWPTGSAAALMRKKPRSKDVESESLILSAGYTTLTNLTGIMDNALNRS